MVSFTSVTSFMPTFSTTLDFIAEGCLSPLIPIFVAGLSPKLGPSACEDDAPTVFAVGLTIPVVGLLIPVGLVSFPFPAVAA